jgi:hypothetical protein
VDSPILLKVRTGLCSRAERPRSSPERPAHPQLVIPFSSANLITCAVFVISSLLINRAR